MFKLLFEDKEFYRKLFFIATPIVVQNLVASSLNMVDTVMVGQLGETQIAAVGLANQFFFLLNLFLFGISSGAAIFTAQFWGKRDIPNIRRVLGMGLFSGIGASFLFMLIAVFIPQYVLGIFSTDIEVITLGSQYLRIVAASYIMTSITFSYAFILRSTEQVRLPMVISIVALSTNTLFNYILIFGHWGAPQLGVRGAALATVIARALEVSLLLFMVYRKGYAPAAQWREMMDISLDFVKKFFRTTIPVILNESLWAVGVTMYTVVYGRMGTGAVASINISSTVERMSMVLFFGMAHACAVMVGNQIGANHEDKAFDYARRFALLGPLVGLFIGGGLFFTSSWILSVYQVSYEVYEGARSILLIFSLVLSVKIFNTINIVGILRSGGDTKFSLFIDTAGVWGIAVPLAILGGLVWELPLYLVYILVNLEELFKLSLGVKRLISRRWINNLAGSIEVENAEPAVQL